MWHASHIKSYYITLDIYLFTRTPTELLSRISGFELPTELNNSDNLDPNVPYLRSWPKWDPSNPKLMTFLDGNVSTAITADTYRAAGME